MDTFYPRTSSETIYPKPGSDQGPVLPEGFEAPLPKVSKPNGIPADTAAVIAAGIVGVFNEDE